MTRTAIRSAGDVIDRHAALAAWERALTRPAWDGTPVWVHTDLLRPNLLVAAGRLSAVIDFGGLLGGPDPGDASRVLEATVWRRYTFMN